MTRPLDGGGGGGGKESESPTPHNAWRKQDKFVKLGSFFVKFMFLVKKKQLYGQLTKHLVSKITNQRS